MVHCPCVRTNKRLYNQRAGLICAFLSRLRQRCYRPHQSIYRPHYAWGYFLCAIFPTKVFSHPLSHCREHILRRRAHFKHLGFANAHFCTPLVPNNCKCSWAIYRLLQVRGTKSTELYTFLLQLSVCSPRSKPWYIIQWSTLFISKPSCFLSHIGLKAELRSI